MYFLNIKKRESGAQRRVRKKARKKAQKRAHYQWTILESLKNFFWVNSAFKRTLLID
jgi:hypothetical protein